ncbi:MAG: SdrD B-like domain-containing protein [Clostridium sp.]|uniref:DUF6923 family protein n=1 Tax=Anaerorhabdus sp. TaxID=1872524 RepID=UPI002FCA1DED
MPFRCSPTAYQVFTPNLTSNSSFRSIDPVTGATTLINPDLGGIINAIGYNTMDNYIYGVYDINDSRMGQIIRIDELGGIYNYGYVIGPPPIDVTNGTFDDKGFLYVMSQSENYYYTIDLRPASPTFMTAVDPTSGYTVATSPYYTTILPPLVNPSGDWVFNPVDGMLYIGDDTLNQLVTISPTTGVSTPIPTITNGFPLNAGGFFGDGTGAIFTIGNVSGQIIKWRNIGGTYVGEFFSQSQPTLRQDATFCIKASILVDFGDAPDISSGNAQGDYTTLLINNGPRHGLINGLKLGTQVTSEVDAYQNTNANGDDLSKGIQDDGLVTPVTFLEGTSMYNLDVAYTNDTGITSYIYAWFDYNQDGIFQLSEAANLGTPIAVPYSTINQGTTKLDFIVPAGGGLISGDLSYLRIRITSEILTNTNTLNNQEDTRSIGPATDGEVEDYLVTVNPAPSFPCSSEAYQVKQPQVSPGIYGNSQFIKIEVITGKTTIVNYDTGYVINAIGYNTIDNYIYGIANISGVSNLIKITASGTTINLGPVANLPLGVNMNVGAIDNSGIYYVMENTQSRYYTIDLRPTSPNFRKVVSPVPPYPLATLPYYTTILPITLSTEDWAFNKLDGLLYTVNSSGTAFQTINPQTGALTIVPIVTPGFNTNYGGMFSDSNGYIYGIDNNTGDIIRWQNISGSMMGVKISQTLTSDKTDATSCVNMQVLIDFGDAPDTSSGNAPNDYTTLLKNNGPRHQIINNLKLGTLITSEPDAYQNITATGDDQIKGIQDDGVSYPIDPIYIGDTTYELPIIYTNSTGNNAIIYGWIDFNRDGVFQVEEAAIPILATSSTGNPQQSKLIFTIPVGTAFNSGDTTFIRVRITSDNLNSSGILATDQDTRSVGPAIDGEVEDYLVTIQALTVGGLVWYDLNCNGIQDIGEGPAPNVTVELYKVGGGTLPFETTTTDLNGEYSFSNVPFKDYYVKITAPNGYRFTIPNVQPGVGINSNVSSSNGESAVFTLNSNNTSTVVNAGLVRKNKISGNAFYDCNKNGSLDNGEPRLCGVLVTLTNSKGRSISTTTDCEGYYEFIDLCSGDYVITGTAPPEISFTTQNSLSYYGSKPDSTSGMFTVTITNVDYNQGYIGFTGNAVIDLQYCETCMSTCSQCTINSSGSRTCSCNS